MTQASAFNHECQIALEHVLRLLRQFILHAPPSSLQNLYMSQTNKKLNYKLKKSSIAYIGTTKKGADRIAASAAKQARDLLGTHGIKRLAVFVVTCRAQRNVESWKFLERALIIRFRELYGRVPVGNEQFKNTPRGPEFRYFSDSSLDKVLTLYEPGVL